MELRFANQWVLATDRPVIMGVLNLTPDSFSDAGMWLDAEVAVARGMEMIAQGAQIIDVGGESTRPGSQPVPAQEQQARVLAVIRALAAEIGHSGGWAGSGGGGSSGGGAAISIDTASAAVAQAALDAGAGMINDVTAGLGDPAMLPLAAKRRAPIVLMHMQGTPQTMQINPTYHDVVNEVQQFLLARAQAARDAGIPAGQIVIDPGIGFGKTKQHNLDLLAHLQRFTGCGYATLLGTSRKRFMGSLVADRLAAPGSTAAAVAAQPIPPLPRELVGATCATTALGVLAGIDVFRVHDVAANRQAADVAWAINRAADAKQS